MALLETMISYIPLNSMEELIMGALAFSVQVTGELGGIRGVEVLFAAGFIIGLLACLYGIKAIER